MANTDIELKILEFVALGSKANMRDFLVKINEDIVSFSNKVRISGSISVLTANYRAHLERIASGGQSTKSKAKGKQRATAADTYEDAPQNAGGLLSKLIIAPNTRVSQITQRCLEVLGSSLTARLLPPDDDNSVVLQPLHKIILAIHSARELIPLLHNHGENYERLNMVISRMDPVEASPMLEPFMTAIGVKRGGPEVDDGIDTDPGGEMDAEATAALTKEVDIIWNAYNFALDRWSETFPEPSAEDMSFPLDFNEQERVTLRNYAREFIKENNHLASRSAQLEDLQGALETLREKWPIEKGNYTAIAQLVLDEARREFNRSESRSRSRSAKGQPQEEGVGGGDEDEDEDDKEEHATKGKGKQSKRKRQLYTESDDESDGASLRSKASRTGRGRGGSRGRTLARRYPSPSKIAAETALRPIDEEDEDEDDDDE